MRACFARTCCTLAVQERDRRATTLQCNIKQTYSSYFILHSSNPALQLVLVHQELVAWARHADPGVTRIKPATTVIKHTEKLRPPREVKIKVFFW